MERLDENTTDAGTEPRKRSRGRKIGIGCLGCLGLTVVMFAVVLGLIALKKNKYDPIVQPYLAEVIPDLSQWETAAFASEFVPEVGEQYTQAELERMVGWFSMLGELESFEEPQFQRIRSSTEVPYPSVVTYGVEAEYENGAASITFELVPVDEGEVGIWSVQFNSEALIPEKESD